MKDIFQTKNINFWLDKNIIHCEFQNDDDLQHAYLKLEIIFLNAITFLSKDKYMPLIVDLKHVKYDVAIKLFKFLSKNHAIKEAVLSTSFLVSSFILKVMLIIYDFLNNTNLPHKICINHHSVVQFCEHKNKVFNGSL